MQYSPPNSQKVLSRPASFQAELQTGLSSIPSSSSDGERPRKRVRKGTKSCWECKRRKVRCQLSSEDVPVCSGCVARGTTCLSQEFPEERDGSGGAQVGERLGRVERLLETLVSKISAYEEEEKSQRVLTPESMGGNDVLSPSAAEASPYFSLFDNTVIGHRDTQSENLTLTPKPAGPRNSSCARVRPAKIDRLRQTLVELLPSQEDANTIMNNGHCWLLGHNLQKMSAQAQLDQVEAPDTIMSYAYNLAKVQFAHPTIIARTLLYLSICIQQLDPSFETKSLRLFPTAEARVERWMSTIQSLITSDDDLVATVEGLECLTLQGVYVINGGMPRRAWLTIRRALNVGQLMGIHKGSSPHREMWHQIVQADRYLALFLGLPAGSSDDVFGPEDNFDNPNIDKDRLFGRRVSLLATRLIERNQSENKNAYTATQEIDEGFDALAKNMPATWWDIPVNIPNDCSNEAAGHFDRLMAQVWYFQVVSLLHLPFMLRAATERRYDYSAFMCLKASREMIWRYLALRKADTKFCCKVVDFGALTATVALFLGILQPNHVGDSGETDRDRALISAVLKSMEELGENSGDVVCAQGAKIIKTLLDVDPSSSSSDAISNGNLRLAIPYFGTISIVRPQPPVSTNATSSSDPQPTIDSQTSANPDVWQGMQPPAHTSLNFPTVSFTSSQFAPFVAPPEQQGQQNLGQVDMSAIGWDDTDTVFFDSLLNADIEGGWFYGQ